MKREIICPGCAKVLGPDHPKDFEVGIRRRTVELQLKVCSMCDHCGHRLEAGAAATAVTYWNRNREGEPYMWESDY